MLTYHLQGGMGSRLRATSITGMLGCLAVNAAVAWTCFRKSPNTEQKVRVHGPVASLETCLLRACFACSCLQFFEETPVEQRMVRVWALGIPGPWALGLTGCLRFVTADARSAGDEHAGRERS